MKTKNTLKRRSFIKNSTAGILGAMAMAGKLPAVTENEKKELKIKEYRLLGRTGFKVSDISTGYVKEGAIIEQLLDAGINYIDSAEEYGNEPEIGKVVKTRERKKIFITTKLEVKEDPSKDGFLKRAYACLERLQTDYIDCLMMHSPMKVSTVKNEGFHQAMAQLKKEGKLHFVGISNHGSSHLQASEEPMDQVLGAAADDGRFDVMLLAYNYLQQDGVKRVLELCRKKEIGVTLMKTNPVGAYYLLQSRLESLKKDKKEIPDYLQKMFAVFEEKYKQAEFFIKKYNLNNPAEIRDAAVKFCLSNPDVHTVCCTMRNFDDVANFVKLSGGRLTPADNEKLSAFGKGPGMFYCRHACDRCHSACPNGVPVNTIMRYQHYFDCQNREKYALKKYASLATAKADKCTNCPGYCQDACPYGIPIHGLLHIAHHNLTLI